MSSRSLPECWGHRGVSFHPVLHVAQPLTRPHAQASATFPENTLASFEKAIRDGAEGIESGISSRVVRLLQLVTLVSRRPRLTR